VAGIAQALQLAEPEFVDVALMRLDVIDDRRRRHAPELSAVFAQRMQLQLMRPHAPPARTVVEMAKGTDAHGDITKGP
jgi:hypothetical protein